MDRRGFLTSGAVAALLGVAYEGEAAPPKRKSLIDVSASDPKVLTGLTLIALTIFDIPDVFDDALDPAQIKTAVELPLRQSGLRIVSPSKKLGVSTPMLNLNLNAMRTKEIEGLVIYNINLSLFQDVILLDSPSVFEVYGATIWEAELVGIVGDHNISSLYVSFKGQVERFCNDWLKANPK